MINTNTVYVEQADYENKSLDPIPMRSSVYCKDIVAYVSRADYEKHLKYKMIADAFNDLAKIKFVDETGKEVETTTYDVIAVV